MTRQTPNDSYDYLVSDMRFNTRLWSALITLFMMSASSLYSGTARGEDAERSRGEQKADPETQTETPSAGEPTSEPASSGSQTPDGVSGGSSESGSTSRSGSDNAQAVDAQEGDAQEDSTQGEGSQESGATPSSAKPPRSHPRLDRALADIVRRATAPMLPDGVNGLIRVMVPTTRGTAQDRPSREVLSAVIAQMIAELPHYFAVNTERVVDVMRDFDRGDQPLTTPRAISLGQHLGARYVFLTELSDGESSDALTLHIQVISVKRRGAIHKESLEISRSDYKSLRARAVFDERQLSAVWRSALIPGWGQLYQGRTGVAVAYAAITVGLTVGALWTSSLGRDAASRYQENTPDGIRYRFEANNHFARSRLMWGALGVTWLSSIASAYIQGEDRSHIKLNFDPAQGGINISGAF